MNRLGKRIVRGLQEWAYSRPANQIIGGVADPYLVRWYLIPRNRFFNVYLHLFLRSDDDRALHDHPWANISVLLENEYVEHRERNGLRVATVRRAGSVTFRLRGSIAHRIELHNGPCWTLFITGPRYREWGFHCPQGWKHWKAFTDPADPGSIGPGCGEH